MRNALAPAAVLGLSSFAWLALAQAPAPPAAKPPSSATPPAAKPTPSAASPTPSAAQPAPSAAKPAPPAGSAASSPSATAPAPAPSASAAPTPAPATATPPTPAGTPSAPTPAPASPPPAPPPAEAPSSAETSLSLNALDRPPPADSAARRRHPDPWQDAHALGAEVGLFVGGRLGDAGFAPAEETRTGLGFDLSAWLTLTKEYVLGFGVTRADLGSVSALSGANQIDTEYGATALHLGARAFPWRGTSSELFVGLRVGLAWQDLDAVGIRTTQPNVAPPSVFSCSGVDGPGLALGAGAGFAERIAGRAWFLAHVDANGYRLSGDVVDNCTVGIGSVTSASLGVGLLYAFDLGEENRLDAKTSPPAYTW